MQVSSQHIQPRATSSAITNSFLTGKKTGEEVLSSNRERATGQLPSQPPAPRAMSLAQPYGAGGSRAAEAARLSSGAARSAGPLPTLRLRAQPSDGHFTPSALTPTAHLKANSQLPNAKRTGEAFLPKDRDLEPSN